MGILATSECRLTEKMSLSLTKKSPNLSLWNLNKERQDEGASELWIQELHSHVNIGLGYGLLQCVPSEVDP